MKINSDRIYERLSTMGKNALFTYIEDIKLEELIDLYRKTNKVDHFFRIISVLELVSPV